jgi:hypothetical protein
MQGLNLLLLKWFNSFFEYCNERPLKEIHSLHYDKFTNKIVIGVSNGFWVISEDDYKGEVRGVFYEE